MTDYNDDAFVDDNEVMMVMVIMEIMTMIVNKKKIIVAMASGSLLFFILNLSSKTPTGCKGLSLVMKNTEQYKIDKKSILRHL